MQLAPRHAGHDHVRDQQVDASAETGRRLQRLDAVRGLDHPVAGCLEHVAEQVPHHRLVLDEQNRFMTRGEHGQGPRPRLVHLRLGRAREMEREGRALAGGAGHEHLSLTMP
jgi:hypothetical protein